MNVLAEQLPLRPPRPVART